MFDTAKIPSLQGFHTEIEYVNDGGRIVKNHSLYKEKRLIIFKDSGNSMFTQLPVYTVHVA
jgi:hypothetical protein